ncbi:MAG: translation initiation factor IF-2 [Flavobacterium sp.]|nr:translation initiation factor IF-2 [Pedobacter sp.]
MSEGKSTNLLKAAKELNIGLSTAADFLGKKGHLVDARPNTKLSDEMYEVLLKEFQGDKNVKDEAKQIVIGRMRRDETPIPTSPEKVEYSRNKDFDQEEILIKNVNAYPAPVEKPHVVSPELKMELKGDEPKVGSESTLPGVKVVGKINLENLNARPRPEKKEPKPEKIELKPEIPKVEGNVVEKPISIKAEIIQPPATEIKHVEKEPEIIEHRLASEPERKPEVVAEPVQPEILNVQAQPASQTEVNKQVEPVNGETTIVADENQPPELYRAKTDSLVGPKIIGKIELPVQSSRRGQPVASSSAAANDHKRKRKRKDHQPGVQGQNQGSPQGANRPANNNPPTNSVTGARPPFRANTSGPNNRGPQTGGNSPRPDFRNKPRIPDGPKAEPTDKEIQDQIKATLARLSGAGKSGKFAQRAKLRRQKRDDVAQTAEDAAMERELQSKILRVTEFVTANELANMLDVQVTQIISTCMSLGMFVSINQRLDAETLTIVADEFGYEIEFVKPEDEETNTLEEPDSDADLLTRAPIVTVMGHVDHGKTSLLDFVRKANVIAGEAGGITQHIGAYEVKLDNDRSVTFLDTPGHEAFTAMRARGAKVTDIAIIVIAADDSVMPQTKEAINHAQAAGVPIVFAFSKVDKPGANTDKIREQLSAMNILVEEWGGKYQSQEISGKTGLGVDLLLEKVLLEADLLDLKANPEKRAIGTVIEAALDKGRGIVTTVLIQAGTLRVGDPILAGCFSGRVKALHNERGQKVEQAGPSTPVQVLGMQGAPTAGDRFNSLESEVEAREIANKRLQLQREQGLRTQKHITLDEIGRRLAIGNFKELNIIVKGDVDGSIEALSDSLLKLSTEEIQVNIIHKSVGQISESDVLLASASDAIIIGFQVRPSASARKLAEQEQIDVRLYSIIYDAINEVKAAMEGMLAPSFVEKITSNVEIREVFKITKVGTIAGCMVLDGKITRNSKIRIIRDGVVIYSGELASLKRFKDDVKEVVKGYECGLNIQNFNNIEVGDIVESYEQVEVKRKL